MTSPGRYARGTTVTVPSTQQELAAVFSRYGVDTYGFGATPGQAVVQFEVKSLPIRVAIPLPPRPAMERVRNPKTGRDVDAMTRWATEVREAWRALLLLVKSGLEAIERGITSADRVFMAWLVTPDGRTLDDHVLPAYLQSLATGRLALTAGDR